MSVRGVGSCLVGIGGESTRSVNGVGCDDRPRERKWLCEFAEREVKVHRLWQRKWSSGARAARTAIT